MALRDPVSSASHLIFAVWAIYALLILLRLASPSPNRRLAAAVFGASMVFVYLASGIFHATPLSQAQNPAEFRFLQRLDQSAIFVLIAGTNTPLQTAFLDGAWRKWCLTGMWSLAGTAIACLWLFPKPPHESIVFCCLGMGWLGWLPIVRYYRAVGWRAMNWVWAGASAYTLGAVCELAERPRAFSWSIRVGYHEVFHLLCGVASVAFFLFIARYVMPYRAPSRTTRHREFASAAKGQASIHGRIEAHAV
jgi:hemolysin III